MSGFLSFLYGFLIVIHVLACLVMMLSILLQAGRSAGLGAGFGGSSQTLFGAGGGAAFLAKFTATTALIFVLTSVGIAKLSTAGEKSLEKKAREMAEEVKKKGEEVKVKDFETHGGEEVSREEIEKAAPAPAPAPAPPAPADATEGGKAQENPPTGPP